MSPRKLILASGSPRRRALLAAVGVDFAVIESGINEDCKPGETPITYASRMATEKATTVSLTQRESIILGADTIVVLDDELLLKPRDAEHARTMLRALSGRTHIVVTAFALACDGRLLECTPVTARVTFRALLAETIERYIATGEPFDKAGGYGIQEGGGEFIARVDGSRDTVMGLPVAEVLAALRRHRVHA
jgi:septum formation protein